MNYSRLLAEALAKHTDLPVEDILATIENPPDPKKGHLAFPCFRLAKALKKAPPVIAQEITANVLNDQLDWIDSIAATGPYVNVFLNRTAFARNVLSDVLKQGKHYGATGIGTGKNVVMDYSSPNIAKPLHVGHLGSTIIGKSLDNIFQHLGYNVTSINHLGDWGTQFGKMIVAYFRWGSAADIERDGIDGLVALYVKFHEEADKDATLNDEAREWVVKMQDGDTEGLRLWQWFIDISMREYDKMYKLMSIEFDFFRGESYYNGMLDGTVHLLREKGLLVESDGAQIVDLEAYNMPPCLILRSDGGTLYATRDIAAAIERQREFEFDLCLYVTGQEQILHFAQWFKAVELMGYPWAKGLVHIPYGMYRFEAGKMSTRRGDVIKMEELVNEAVAKTRNIIEEKNPTLPNKEKVAEQVGVGALFFNKLYNSRMKDTVFNWEQMLSFDGETGPYVQYTHARACSVLEKGGAFSTKNESDAIQLDTPNVNIEKIDYSLLTEDETFNVLRLIYDFPASIEDAAEKYEPYIVARHMVALAQAYNVFYHKHTILVDDPALKNARLALTAAARTVLKSGLSLLGISAPVAM